jgi:hypothetical protein
MGELPNDMMLSDAVTADAVNAIADELRLFSSEFDNPTEVAKVILKAVLASLSRSFRNEGS